MRTWPERVSVTVFFPKGIVSPESANACYRGIDVSSDWLIGYVAMIGRNRQRRQGLSSRTLSEMLFLLLGFCCQLSAEEIFSTQDFGKVASYKDSVYVPLLEKGLLSIDGNTGHKNWEVSVEACCPAIGQGGTVYFLSRGSRVLAVQNNDGQEVWSQDLPDSYGQERLSAPAIGSAGRLYLLVPGELLAINSSNGKLEWSTSVDVPTGLPPMVYESSDHARVCVAGGKKIEGYNTSNGKRVWSYEVGGKIDTGGGIETSPVVDLRGRIYVAAGRAVFVVDAISGKHPRSTDRPFFSLPFERDRRSGARVVIPLSGLAIGPDENLYVTDEHGGVRALDTRTGEEKWSRSPAASINVSPVVNNKRKLHVVAREQTPDNSEPPRVTLKVLNGRNGDIEREEIIEWPGINHRASAEAPPNLNDQGTLFVAARSRPALRTGEERLHAIETDTTTSGLQEVPWSQYGKNGRNTGRVTASEQPEISVSRGSQGELLIEWTGILESSKHVDGPYSEVEDAKSPMEVDPGAKKRFWRARSQ